MPASQFDDRGRGFQRGHALRQLLLIGREQIELLRQPLEGQHPLGPQLRRAENDHDRQHHRDSNTYPAFHTLSLGREQAAYA